MVRLTDIIKGDTGQEDPKDKEKPLGDEGFPGEGGKGGGYSLKNVGQDFRQRSGVFSSKEAPPMEKGGMSLKGLLSSQKESEKIEEKKPSIPRGEIEKIYSTMFQYIRFISEKVKRNEPFNLNEGLKMIDFIIKTPDALDILYGKAVAITSDTDILFANFVNVSIYAMKIGLDLKYDTQRLIQLGIAGLVHDIGMARVPDHIARKTQRLEGDDFELLKRHTVFGAEILRQLGPNYSWLVEAVSQEHERENGKGYPQGLVGDQICEFARIIGVADVYDALTSPRPQRKRFLPYEATKEIVQSQKGFYWPKAVKSLLTSLSAFPVGSYVRLNSRAIARVVESNKAAPLRPKVVIMFDAKGEEHHDEKVMDLQKNTLIYVTESVSLDDLPTSKKP